METYDNDEAMFYLGGGYILCTNESLRKVKTQFYILKTFPFLPKAFPRKQEGPSIPPRYCFFTYS